MPNRLIHEDSPYLRQHASNPVDWYPWGEAAFKKAREKEMPIFLSIGYSSCHWCHVMEHEVFENQEIAAYLNDRFVSIKVDREERPDIDKHFQEVYQLLNQGAGGWPTSIFLTPDLKPFFAATYIPPVRRYNMMGFLELCEVIAEKWNGNREQLVKGAENIHNHLSSPTGPNKTAKLNPEISEIFIRQAGNSFDTQNGGFSKAPKFPHTSTIKLLLNLSVMKKRPELADIAFFTLQEMARGGMRDLIDGGFCRYSVDERWLVPHFEKMTYDNALLCQCYLLAYEINKDPFYLKIAKEIKVFMQEFMCENHLFYTASDADSQGVEGKYFVFLYQEAVQAFMDNGFNQNEALEIAQRLSITPSGNFEGKNIVRNEALTSFKGYEKAIKALRNVRRSRIYPFIDKKVIVSWNAMMIKALFLLTRTDESCLKDAQKSMEALLEKMWIDGVLYHSAMIDKPPRIEAFLEDYAYLADTLIAAHQTTLDSRYLELAATIVDQAKAKFEKDGKWLFSIGEFPTEAEPADSSYPSSIGTMLSVLLSLAALVDQRYMETAIRTLKHYSTQIIQYPMYTASLTSGAVRYLNEDIILKAPPERLEDARKAGLPMMFPPLLITPRECEGFLLCNAHSCFANPKGLDELWDLLKRTDK